MLRFFEKKILLPLEDDRIPFIYFVLTFFFACTLRCFLEIWSDVDLTIKFSYIYHYWVSYVCLALSLVLIFRFGSGEKIRKIMQAVLPSFIVLILTPIIDLTVTGGKGFDLNYLLPDEHPDLLFRLLTFFGALGKSGVSIGIRVEIGLVLIATFLYFQVKKSSIIRSIFFTLVTYVVIFLYCAAPSVIMAVMNFLGAGLPMFDVVLAVFLLLTFFLGWAVFYCYNRDYLMEIVKDLRPYRLLHYQLIFLLGTAIAAQASPVPVQFDQFCFFYGAFVIFAILFAWLFSLIVNNLADYQIDSISNQLRPTITKNIPDPHYRIIGWTSLALAVLYAASVNFRTLFLILLFIGNYYLYSMPPLRLKRVLCLSKVLIGLNTLTITMIGYAFVAGDVKVPWKILVLFLVGFSIVINFIDLKDYEGDLAAGINTLPTVLGLKWSKLLIGLFFLTLYPAAAWLLDRTDLLIPLTIIGFIEFLLIIRKNYSERPVFVVYLLSVIALLVEGLL